MKLPTQFLLFGSFLASSSAAPVSVAPAAGVILFTPYTSFAWQPVEEADYYEIRSSLAEAARGGPAVLHFQPGLYRLRVFPGDVLLSADDLRDLQIEGQGARIIQTEPRAGFISLRRATNVTIRGFTIDYDPIPFVVARVEEVKAEEGRLIIRPLSGNRSPADPSVLSSIRWGVFLDPL